MQTVYISNYKASEKNLSVVLCQTSPVFKQKTSNIARFKQIMNKLQPEDAVDIIIYPQMAFTGYNFKDKQDAMPLAVNFGQGEEFEFARAQSIRLKAYILFGYIEKVQAAGSTTLYNSAALADRSGKFIFNTRKTHLYYADELWATEGDGFKTISIFNRKGQVFKCAVAICMDINPKNFTSGKYEFGEFVKQNNCEIIMFPTNWIDFRTDDKQSNWYIYKYWINRLQPPLTRSQKKMFLLAADRVGQQYAYFEKKNTWFMGASCVLQINPHQVLQHTGKDDENIVKATIYLPA